MSHSPLPADILKLSIPQRVHLVEQIWDSIAEDEKSFELTASQKRELDRRLAAHEANPDEGKSWEELKQDLRGT